MSQVDHASNDDSTVQQYFASLDKREKIADWVYGTLIVGCGLLVIIAGVVLLS